MEDLLRQIAALLAFGLATLRALEIPADPLVAVDATTAAWIGMRILRVADGHYWTAAVTLALALAYALDIDLEAPPQGSRLAGVAGLALTFTLDLRAIFRSRR